MTKPKQTVEDIWDVLPEIQAQAQSGAAEAEERRWIGDDLANKLLALGVGRLLLDTDVGGLGGTLSDWIRLGTELSAADASTGWVALHWAMASAVVAANGSEKLIEEVFSDPKACVASSNLGRVQAIEEPDGLRISGSWGFASGCLEANYLGGDLILDDPDEPTGVRMISVLSPRSEASIVESWNPVGLAATGSHQIVYDNVFVPQERIYRWPDSKPVSGRTRGFLGHGVWFISLSIASVHLGLARRAIDEVRSDLSKKMNKFTNLPMIATPTVLRALEDAEGMLYCMRAGIDHAVEDLWAEGLRDGKPSLETRMAARVAALAVIHQGTGIVRSVFDIAGASALDRAGALQRVFRDANCLTQHVAGSLNGYELTGRVRNELDPLSFKI